jgi:hypothetical protein
MWSNADRFTSANDRRFGHECKMPKTFCREARCDYKTLWK